GDQRPCDLLTGRPAKVEPDGFLAAPDHRPPWRMALGHGLAPLAHRVADLRVLELDHLRPVVGQDLTAERAGDERAHLDDDEAGQGAGGGRGAHPPAIAGVRMKSTRGKGAAWPLTS